MNYLKPHQEKPNIALLEVVFKEKADFTMKLLFELVETVILNVSISIF